MNRSPKRPTARVRQPRKRATSPVFIVIAYDRQTQSLSLIGTSFRSGAPSATETKAVMSTVQRLLKNSTWRDQPERAMTVSLRLEKQASHLTAREVEILRLVARGKITTEIAKALSISPRTASTHVRNILTKMKAKNRVEAVLKALQLGYLSLTSNTSTSLPRPNRRTGRSKARKR